MFGQFEGKKNGSAALVFRQLCGVLFLVYLAGCATGNSPVVESKQSNTQTPPPSSQSLQHDVRVELSASEVAAGTLVLVTLHLSRFEATNGAETKVETGQGPPLPKIDFLGEFEGISFSFFTAPDLGPNVYEAVLGIPYERKPGPGVIQVRGAKRLEIPIKIVDGHYPSETLHVNGSKVNPTKKKVLTRIIREIAEVSEIYKRVTPQKYWTGRFDFPIQSKMTSVFGSKRVYNGRLKNYHTGMDLKAAMLTPVYSAAPGIVVLAKNLFYTGNTVMMDHGYGIVTLYAHMNELKVKIGDIVSKHMLLGLSGKTGRVNGPHLHWQAVVHHVKVNPLGLIEVMR